jgi:bacillithiol biosynthesis cysteine-adding enzyme BshC
MELSCIRQTELPHTTKLFADYIYHPERVERFFPYSTHDPRAFAKAADAISYPDDRRAALVAALRIQNGDHPALDLLARPGTVAVVTGQQVGLFSGPAYTIYKALTAVHVARRLTAQGIPAVPIFWLATEDHDFAEVNQAWVFDARHRPTELRAEAAPGPNQPVGTVPIISAPWEQAAQAMQGLPFADEAVALIRSAYQPGRTFGEAFAAVTDALLGKFGLLRVDPMAPEIRDLAAPLLRQAVEAAPALTDALLERGKQLLAAGYHAQVHFEAQTSLFFLLEQKQRISLRRQGDHYLAQGRRVTSAELLDRAPHLSPNALLRPVVQDYILPTVAYIGGPAELAYLAQSQVLYRQLLGRQPIALHRAGFTLIDARSAKRMRHFGLELPDFFHGQDRLREQIAAKLVPPAVLASVAAAREQTASALARLSGDLADFDKSLEEALATSRRKIEYQVAKIERKIGREALARDARAADQAASLCGLIYPQKHLQERLYSAVPFIAKHGLGVVDQIHNTLQLDCPDHRVLELT